MLAIDLVLGVLNVVLVVLFVCLAAALILLRLGDLPDEH
jgi:hypothetical protein